MPRSDVALADIDLMPYAEYLRHPHWAALCDLVRQRSGGMCERCTLHPHEQTHHHLYRRLRSQTLLADLAGLCTGCHRFMHGRGADPLGAVAWLSGRGDSLAEPRPVARYQILLSRFATQLPDSRGQIALARLGVGLEAAAGLGIGYAPPGQWPGTSPPDGRLVAPLTDRYGRVVNLVGIAVCLSASIPADARYEVLRGDRGGLFTATAARATSVMVTGSPEDAILLRARGAEAVLGLVHLADWRPAWAASWSNALLAADLDQAGSGLWRRLAADLRRHGVKTSHLSGAGRQSLAAAWLSADSHPLDAILAGACSPAP